LVNKEFITDSEEKTNCLAEQFAAIAKKGDVFALFGTLGVGKSVFSRAFIKKLTAAEEVPSPTFTLVQSYPFQDMEIYHFDLYRLKSPQEIFELGFEEAVYQGISLIEWPEKAGNFLPKDIFQIHISMQENQRIFNIMVTSAEKAERLEQINDC